MKNYASQALTICALISLIVGCSSNSDTTGGSTTIDNLITQTYSAVSSQLSEATGVLDLTSASIHSNSVHTMAAPSFGTNWSSMATLPNPITNSGNVTIKDWMGYQLDSQALNANNSAVNVFGRVNNALAIFCAVGVGSGMAGISVDSSGYPANGVHTITFSAVVKAQMSSQCDIDTSSIPNDTSMQLTVASASGDYDKQFTFDTFNQEYFVKSTSTVVNILTAETQDNNAISRTIVQWDKTSQVIRGEYVTNPAGATSGASGLYAYRLFYDEANDLGQILTYEGADTAATDSTRYILAGKPRTGDAFSISMKARGVESFAKLEACVDGSTGDIFTDGSRCVASSTRLNGAAIDSVDTIFSNFFGQKSSTGWATVTTSTTLGWSTSTDMLTTALTP